jgi:hypothetical protein
MAGVWTTKEMTPPTDKELFAQATIRELAIYCTFLVVLSMGKLKYACRLFGNTSLNNKRLLAQATTR